MVYGQSFFLRQVVLVFLCGSRKCRTLLSFPLSPSYLVFSCRILSSLSLHQLSARSIAYRQRDRIIVLCRILSSFFSPYFLSSPGSSFFQRMEFCSHIGYAPVYNVDIHRNTVVRARRYRCIIQAYIDIYIGREIGA